MHGIAGGRASPPCGSVRKAQRWGSWSLQKQPETLASIPGAEERYRVGNATPRRPVPSVALGLRPSIPSLQETPFSI